MIEPEMTGTFWCETCQAEIPNQYTDHAEMHRVTQSPSRWPGIVLLWAFCVAGGVIAGVAFTYLT
jgi:hypothetical protein